MGFLSGFTFRCFYDVFLLIKVLFHGVSYINVGRFSNSINLSCFIFVNFNGRLIYFQADLLLFVNLHHFQLIF